MNIHPESIVWTLIFGALVLFWMGIWAAVFS